MFLHTSFNNFKLNPFYVSGFSDAEGSFIVSIVERSYSKIGWGIGPAFKIELHLKDLPLLNRIQIFFWRSRKYLSKQ